MSQVNYTAMSDQELRQHFLKRREDKLKKSSEEIFDVCCQSVFV
jgi:hypothetical protein